MKAYPDNLDSGIPKRYLYVGILITFLLQVALLTNNTLEPLIVIWQLGGMLIFLASLHLVQKLSINAALFYIAAYQLALSFILLQIFDSELSLKFNFGSVDTELYNKIGLQAAQLPLAKVFDVIGFYLEDISDQGYPLFISILYRIWDGDTERVRLFLLILNVGFQTLTVYLIYDIAKIVGLRHGETMWIIGLWGLNGASLYFNVSMLKEPLFLLLCTAVMHSIYKVKSSGGIMWHLSVVLFITLTWFFRYYMSLFFIIIYLGYYWFPRIYNKYFAVVCITAMIICIVLPQILGSYIPAIDSVVGSSSSFYQSKGLAFRIFSIPVTFLGPIPRFYSPLYVIEQFLFTFSIPKFFLSGLAIWGGVKAIQNNDYRVYPLISIFLFTSLLLIVSLHMLDYRYIYIILPCAYILMTLGARQRTNLYPIYMAAATVILFLFNMQLY